MRRVKGSLRHAAVSMMRAPTPSADGWSNASCVVFVGLMQESYEDAQTCALAMVNTIMAASGGALCALLIQLYSFKKWSLMMLCNGSLAGMVSVCAGANQ